jgi:hypothetical protein
MRKRLIGAVGAAGLVLIIVFVGSAIAAKKERTRPFTETTLGAAISHSGASYESAYRIDDSVDGKGAELESGTTVGNPPTGGADTVTEFFADGSVTAAETFSIVGPPDANGNVPLAGTGKCTGGTARHKHAECNYTFTETLNISTGITQGRVTGTESR